MTTIQLPTRIEIEKAFITLQKRDISSELIPDQENIYLKLDCSLPGNSYKIRGAQYFSESISRTTQSISVLSAGNLAIAAAICLCEKNILCESLVPEGISQVKKQTLMSLGSIVEEKPFSVIWELVNQLELQCSSVILHPFNPFLLAGYASIIVELMEDNINKATLIVPYGLGGLAISLAHAIKLFDLDIKLVICEIENASPFFRAITANEPITGNKLQSFIEAMGTPCVIKPVFDYLKNCNIDTIQVTEEEVKHQIYYTFNKYGLRIEGAAGASLAAAKKLQTTGPIISLLTGSNISESIFEDIIISEAIFA